MSKEKQSSGTSLIPSVTRTGMLVAGGDDISAAFGGAVANLPRAEAPGITIARIDHKKGKFLVNGEPFDTLRGYILHFFQARAWWQKGYKPGEHSPPDCWSPDNISPAPLAEHRQANDCYSCPMAAWGSAPQGNGQACKVQTFLFLLNPEAFGTPPVAALILPPSSIREVVGTSRSPGYLQRAKQVRNQVTGKSAGYYELVWTEFSLEQAGDTHYVVKPSPIGVAESVEEATAIAGLKKSLHKSMEELRGQVAVVAENAGDAA